MDFILLNIRYYINIHPVICNIMILGKGLVSDEDAACVPGVICLFAHYYRQLVTFARSKNEVEKCSK